MTKFNTGNPVGSADPRDLYDNAENLDSLVNGDQAAYNDRLGKSRRSWQSVEDQVNQQEAEFNADQSYRADAFQAAQTYRAAAFQAAQDDREGVFNSYLVSAGYQFAGDYAAGIEITQYNQVVRDTSGEFWRVSGSTELPHTTTGAGLPEGGSFVAVGDAALRQDLNGHPADGQGAALVRGATIYAGSVTDLLAINNPVDGQTYDVVSYRAGWNASMSAPTGGGRFVWVASSTATEDGGLILKKSTVATGRFHRSLSGKTLETAMYGVDLSGTEAAGQKVLAAKTAAEANDFALMFNNGEYNMGATELVFDKAMRVFGESRDGVQLNFALGDAAKTAIHVAKNASVNGFQLESMTINGTPAGTGLATGNSGTANYSCVDSSFRDLRVFNFGIGLRQQRSWCNDFSACRFQACTKPADLGSQVNATTYTACSWVTFTDTFKMSNCEGLHFDSCNISNSTNVTNGVAMTLYQSNAVFTNPYFENNAATLMMVGATSEAYNSSAKISGGIATQARIVLGVGGSVASVKNIRSLSGTGAPIEITSEPDAPTYYGDVELEYFGTSKNRPKLVFEFKGNRDESLPGAYGGSVRYFRQYRDFQEIEQTAPGNGVTVYDSLVVGRQYTIMVCVRADATVGPNVRIDTLGSRGLLIPATTEDWEWRVFPYVANGTTLRWLFEGKLQVKSIKIYEGAASTPEEIPEYSTWESDSAPTVGAWNAGDRVYRKTTSAGSNIGWTCVAAGTPGMWKTFGTIEA